MDSAVLEIAETSSVLAQPRPSILTAGPVSADRLEAWTQFLTLPMPKRTDEAWRFTNLKHLDLSGYTHGAAPDDASADELVARSTGLESVAGRMVFANDHLLTANALGAELRQKGVIWCPLEQAAAEHPELFARYFMREEAILGGQKFAALHRSQARAGLFLYVPRAVEIALPIETFHWLHGANASCFPHTLIVAEEMAKVTVIDYFRSADENAPGFACGVNDLWLGSGANVTYVCAQNWSRRTLALQMNSTVVGRDASALALNLNIGAAFARNESVSYLRGAGARSDMLAVSAPDGAQEFDQRTFQDHAVPNTASDLLYKNALDDQARTVFSGLIRVDPGAHRTDAYQKVRNLLLSDEAEANSAPGLEIEANDVRCTHGATSGQIEEEELFYLLSRGITRKAAQKLIVFGFLNEVFDRLRSETLKVQLRDLLRAKLGAAVS
ncbi:MAG TPA: Fe-S cluster assembly protein SufD [Chthoniobacteraceae bacterium]|jgi:Fe-S cluster assembly protein SufD|nr:Fe-S cluster assembly protein SufD [Chthoniobacteraceae bacterium]